MGAFEDKLIGQRVKIYIIRADPWAADKGDKILFTYLFGDVFSDLIFVDKLGIQGFAVMELQPLELFIKGLGIFKIEFIAHIEPELSFKKGFIRHPVEHIAAGKKIEHIGRA